jgi:hypothetical protein
MALTIATPLQDALEAYERYGIALFTFNLGGVVYGLWTGQGEKTISGVTYRAGGSVIEFDDIDQNADGSVVEVTLKLSAQPDKGLTSDVIQTFYDEDWQFGRVHIQIGMQNPADESIFGLVTLIKGAITNAPWEQDLTTDSLEVVISSTAIRTAENGGKYRNQATQKAIDPSDTSLVGIGSLGGAIKKDLKWNQTA